MKIFTFILTIEYLYFCHAHWIQNMRDSLLENQRSHLVKVFSSNEGPMDQKQSLRNENSLSQSQYSGISLYILF